MAVTLITPIARLSYPHLVKARLAPGSTEAKFGAMLILEPGDGLKPIYQAILDAGVEKFGNKAADGLKSGALHNPLRKGDSRPEDPNVEGKYFLSPNSKERPELVDRDRAPVLHDIETLFYPGAYVRGVVAFSGFDVQMKKGVGCFLNALQFVRHGPRIDGRRAAAKLFDDNADLGDEGDYEMEASAPAGRRPGAQAVPW